MWISMIEGGNTYSAKKHVIILDYLNLWPVMSLFPFLHTLGIQNLQNDVLADLWIKTICVRVTWLERMIDV